MSVLNLWISWCEYTFNLEIVPESLWHLKTYTDCPGLHIAISLIIGPGTVTSTELRNVLHVFVGFPQLLQSADVT
jgi:hypothetical protein